SWSYRRRSTEGEKSKGCSDPGSDPGSDLGSDPGSCTSRGSNQNSCCASRGNNRADEYTDRWDAHDRFFAGSWPKE
ncbi:MAG: hypothetical protein ACKO2E_06135, partial [Actinomycetota bacterium]